MGLPDQRSRALIQSIVFQNPYASLNPRFTVGQILSEPLLIHGIGGSDTDQVMVMNQGEVVEFANSDDIYQRPQHPYTRKLLSAIPKADERIRSKVAT